MHDKKVDPIGGQAVIEGVMMRGKKHIAMAVRTPQKTIKIEKIPFTSWTKKYPVLGFFVIRGFITMIEMLRIGSKMLIRSAEIALPQEENKPMGKGETFFTYFISFTFAMGLFLVLPAFVFSSLEKFVNNTILLNMLEGFVRLSIFVVFLYIVSFMKDMRRVFEYHGAEHKVVNMYEHKEPLTVERARLYSVRHPRCGTSFLLVVMLVSIIIFSFLGRPDFLHRVLYKLMLLPFVSGVSYEVIRFTDRYKKSFLKFLTYPGVLLQHFTTREPSDDQVEVAIASLQTLLES